MTTYKGINGFAVQSVASDPSPLDEGQVWYNNATYAFKLASVTTAGTWAAGGTKPSAQDQLAGAGTQTSALAFGGAVPSDGASSTELYNGTSWTSNPTGLGTARRALGGCGTQTAALAFGGKTTANVSSTETWNGSTWSPSPASYPASPAVAFMAAAGTQTAALGFGGVPTGPTVTNQTFEFDGSSWTTGGNMNTARRKMAGFGTQTAALAAGGLDDVTPALSAVESYNGTSWTATTSLPSAVGGNSGAGTQTLGLSFGGDTPASTGATVLWNGSSWTTNPNSMATSRGTLAGAGTQAAGLAFGGNTGSGATGATEEFTGPGVPQTKTITTS